MENNVYTRITILCEQNKITVSQLEKTLVFSQSSMNKWPQNIPSAEKIKAVADFFNVSMDYLYCRTQIPSIADNTMDEDMKILQEARQRMTKEEWSRAMNILRAGFPEAFNDQ